MTPPWPIKPQGWCCATSATSRPGSVKCARHCARPAAPARPSARPRCRPAWAWLSFTRAGRRPGWPPSRTPCAGRMVWWRPESGTGVPSCSTNWAGSRPPWKAGDTLWTARALTPRAVFSRGGGSPSRADADYVSALRLYSTTGQELEALSPMLNRALVAFASGDLPAALARLDAATLSYQRLKVPAMPLRVDRCAVLLAAGLVGDALAEAEAALREIEEIHGRLTYKPELLLMAANCALAATQPQTALDWAQAAYLMFRSQRSAWRQPHAARVLVQARYEVGPVSAQLLREANRSAARLDALGSSDAAQAHLLAGRIALDLGRRDVAERHLAALARTRRRGPALSRVSGWLGEALRAEAAGRPSRMLTACRRGLDVLDEYRLALGASELRAQATVHGAELAALAPR